ncbi:MAG TPA: iron-containing alcohol dehydrogenase [Geminicoccus sp.]|jgi:alcohol dehydrogenase class IV|uniref:iron-containing alcohol dehydrogenase n=1 Tax=Geminicoccus sp. TaxID=2024832 RepID=UPI002E321F55|nr:iron-containing alcohol dehydrogenase [Geminicoccus sp.]HEX2525773.1 iron-containing alcohol dehydrogenase [Geminicoccus sp.]
MSSSFGLERGTPVAFGEDRVLAVAEDVTAMLGSAARILLVTDRAIASLDRVVALRERLAMAGHHALMYAEIVGDPDSGKIEAAAEMGRRHAARLVIAVGGGSAIDAGKLAAVALAGRQHPDTYALCAVPLPRDTLPIIAVPTTAGTGAEMTRTAVFTNSHGHKVWAWGEELRPALAVLDPALSVSLPAKLTAWTGLDALVHAIEAATNRRANPLVAASALHAIRLVCRHLGTALDEPGNLEARGGMLIAAALAGTAIDNAGTGIAHAIGHAMGTLAHVHHGRAVALALSAALEANQEETPRLHADVATAMGVLPQDLVASYDRLLDEVEVGRDLSDVDLGPDQIDELYATTLSPENMPMLQANCRHFTEEELRELISAVLTG